MQSKHETADMESHMNVQKGSECILLVDDQQEVLAVEKAMLVHLGYRVIEKNSGMDALDAFRSNPEKFDLVMTDMTMPNMTGDQLAEEVLKIRSEIPVILCTGYSDQISSAKAAFVGIEYFLPKPLFMEDLSRTLRNALDKKG